MKIAISQPTYLPWQGYFALIEYVDEFIFLENIQFNKRSWQQRNKILNNREEVLLTIPVKTKPFAMDKINTLLLTVLNFLTFESPPLSICGTSKY